MKSAQFPGLGGLGGLEALEAWRPGGLGGLNWMIGLYENVKAYASKDGLDSTTVFILTLFYLKTRLP